jgi:hypothetical protein
MNRAAIALLVLAGCSLMQEKSEQYYAGNWDPPEVENLSTAVENGNVGGSTVEIRGSGFGTDASQILVQFGDHNAEVLSVEDTKVTVIVPAGPIAGGAVPVRVATPTGFYPPDGAADSVTYTYDVGTVAEDQVGYVQVNNFWESCYGGLSDRDDNGAAGCDDIAYIGLAGIDGQAEALKFAYPRLHTQYIGFMGGTDRGDSEWKFERPGQLSYAAAIDDLHKDIGDVVLTNEEWAGKDFCADVNGLATFRYGGGQTGEPGTDDYLSAREAYAFSSLDHADGELVDEGESCREGRARFDVDQLPFCTTTDAVGVPSYVYEAQWPVAANFFEGPDELTPATIAMTASEVGIEGQELTLPESLVVYAREGVEPVFEGATDAGDLWALSAPQGCFDDGDNGEDLNDTAISFAWKPAEEWQPTAGLDQETYVRVTFTALALNWFGTSGYPVRATIVVPDEHDYEKRDDVGERSKFSHLDIPASVLYQFPTVRLPIASGFGGEGLLDSSVGDWGYIIVTFERVTEYKIPSSAGGDVVFSYTTGDFGFYGWTNPTDDSCHNCLDDDDDSWTDADDPDCEDGTEETGKNRDVACNDGRDNDGDGLVDSADDLCESGTDEDESNCTDGRDNDNDDLADEEDPECADGRYEGADGPPCENDADDDGDGWTDADDPDCATEDDEVGFGQTECNDGVDNDADGLSDVEDTDCASAASNESGVLTACEDELDNDLDGWTDTEDPDCATGADELGFGTTECNDGVDNDTDELIDALDLDCATADGAESVAASDCADGLDGDLDGWTDGADPDCVSGTSEVGTGSTQCNDGVDNDGDLTFDALDLECADAADDDEGS